MANYLRALSQIPAVAALGLAASLMSAPAQAAEVTQLRVSVIPIGDVAPLFVAMQKGYFAEEGLEVSTAPVAGGAQGIPALVAGAYQISFSNIVSTLSARQQGIDLKIIAPATRSLSEPPDGAALVARAGEGLKTGKDLEGKSMAVNTRNNIIWLFAREWIAKTGGDPDKVTFREVPFPQMLDTLRGNQVDTAFVVQPLLLRAMGDPTFELVSWPYHVVQPNTEVAQYVATAAFVRDNPQTVEKFARALRKGIAWFNANLESDELFEIMSGYTRIPAPVLKRVPVGEMPMGIEKDDSIALTMDMMIRQGLLPAKLDVSDLIYKTAR